MLIVILIGVGLLFRAVRELRESRDAISWPTASGRILKSQMKTHTQNVRRRSSNGIRRSYHEEIYTADIEYEYEVDHTPYKGTRITAVQGGTLSDKPHVQQTLDKYPVGEIVSVTYNPTDPSQSLLEPGSWGGFLVLAGLSLFLIVLPSVVIWIGWHPKHSQIISGL